MTNMYSISIWKLYYKLMRNMLPAYFNFMKPILPNICALYQIRIPLFHPPRIKHKFAEQLVEYQLIKLLNKNGSFVYTSRVQTHSFLSFKQFLKSQLINKYSDQCMQQNCESCRILANPIEN